jgi:hypothetical protein
MKIRELEMQGNQLMAMCQEVNQGGENLRLRNNYVSISGHNAMLIQINDVAVQFTLQFPSQV